MLDTNDVLNKKLIRVSYEIVTPEDAEAGDTDNRGWENEEGQDVTPDKFDTEEGITAVDNAVKFIEREGGIHASSSHFNPGVWYSTEGNQDPHTGATSTYSFHLDGFTPEEEQEIFNRITKKKVTENSPAMKPAPIHDPGASNKSKITQTNNSSGTGVVELESPTGLKIQIVPVKLKSDGSLRFLLHVDGNHRKDPQGQNSWSLEDISKKLSEFGDHGVSIEDILALTNKLEVIHSKLSQKPKPEVAKTNQNGFVVETGFEFFEDDSSINEVNESIDEAFKDNSNVELPNKDTTMEEKEPVVEGQYLQSGLSTREAPIPFTQDPECEGVPDYLSDEEKAGKLSKQTTGSISGTGVDGGGEAMSESILDQFKKGDTVCIDRVMDVEWLVESVSINPDKIVVKHGKRTKVVSPSTTFIEHADGVELHKERQFENIEALKEAYKKMTFEEDPRALKANWCTYEENSTPEKKENTLPILEKDEMYSFIKGNDLHKTDEVAAYQTICEKYGNAIAEVEKIMEDVKSSESNEKVDQMYNFNATPYEENSIGLATTLEAAWKEMEAKELEETAKLSDELGMAVDKQIKGVKINL
jgi:hypothetical protein